MLKMPEKWSKMMSKNDVEVAVPHPRLSQRTHRARARPRPARPAQVTGSPDVGRNGHSIAYDAPFEQGVKTSADTFKNSRRGKRKEKYGHITQKRLRERAKIKPRSRIPGSGFGSPTARASAPCRQMHRTCCDVANPGRETRWEASVE